MQAARNIVEMGVNFADSLTTCDIGKIHRTSKKPNLPESGKTEITERLQFVSTDFLGHVIPAACWNYRSMAKYSEHYTQ